MALYLCVSLCIYTFFVVVEATAGAFRRQALKCCHFVDIWPILMRLDAKCKYVSRSVVCRPASAQKRPASFTEIALKFVSEWVGGWIAECVSE